MDKDNFSFAPSRHRYQIGDSQLIGVNAADRLLQSNFSVYTNDNISIYEMDKVKLDQEQYILPHPGKFDLSFLNKFVDEVDTSIKQTHEFKQMIKNYKLATSKFSKSSENEFLTNLIQEKKNQIFRDISRIYDQKEEAVVLKDKVRKIITYKLEDTRRNLQDTKWNLSMNLLQVVMNKNRANKDMFDLLQKRDLPQDLRQLVWKVCLENKHVADEYYKKLNQARLLTMSKYDVSIIKDCEQFVNKLTIPDEFDGTMIFAMKTILSYYEVKQDRILTDYLYLIAIPLVYAFGKAKYLLKIPSDLIGFFFTLQNIITFFDPYVDLIIKHDEAYDAQMTDLFLNSLNVLDEALAQKIHQVLNLNQASQRTLLVLVIKRFVHSLGFAFLSMDITMFVWDQIIMKIIKNKLEIFVVMAISFFCLRDQILACKDWDKIVDTYYTIAKSINYEQFKGYYLDVIKNVKFYISPYQVDPVLVNRNCDFATDPLTQIVDDQIQKDVDAYKRKWFEGGEYYDLDGSSILDKSEMIPKDKQSAVRQMKMEEALRNVMGPTSSNRPQNLGMVPLVSNDDDDNQDDILAGMSDQEEQ